MSGALIAGVDEAGRGPVLGPLVVACALTDAPLELAALGVRDSKVLTARVRERLEAELKRRLTGWAVVALEPADIDRRAVKGLNALEGEAFVGAVLKAAGGAGVVALSVLQADAADASEARFRARLVRGLARQGPGLAVAAFAVEHKADARYPAVGAASILAKVERDRRVRRIAEVCGADVGSGYPSDPVTIAFLRDYIRAHKDLPAFARRSWQTSKDLLNEAGRAGPPLERFAGKESPK